MEKDRDRRNPGLTSSVTGKHKNQLVQFFFRCLRFSLSEKSCRSKNVFFIISMRRQVFFSFKIDLKPMNDEWMDVFLLTSFLSKLKNNDEIEVCASAAAGRLSVGSSAGPGSNPVEANFVKRKCPTRPSYADELSAKWLVTYVAIWRFLFNWWKRELLWILGLRYHNGLRPQRIAGTIKGL